jgi:alanine dehydrogenase
MNDTLLLLNAQDILALLTQSQALADVRRAYISHSTKAGKIFPLVREPLPSNAVFGIKSGSIMEEKLLGFKAAGSWPANTAKGKDSHQGTIMLFDPETGRPLVLMDGNHITSMRTGAAGGIGIQMLAREGSTRVCVFGSGVQAQIQLDYALHVQPSIRDVMYLTANGQTDVAFESKFKARCNLRHATHADEAVSQADIVITATPSRQALFSLEAVKPGTHINAVGADTKGKRELPLGLIEKAFVVVDDVAQARGVGECQWASERDVIEIGSLLQGNATQPFQRPPDAITVFDLTGIALQDLTVAQSLYQTAMSRSFPQQGQRIQWSC